MFETSAAEPDAVLLRFARRAMATTFEAVLPLGTPDAAETAEALLDGIDRLEDQLTVYRDTSEVSRINARAAHEPVAVEEHLFDLLMRCREWRRETRGAFDPAAGRLVKLWGFWRREGRVPSVDERKAALTESGMDLVTLDVPTRTVRFARPGVEFNLGSVGKGYALDRVVRETRRDGRLVAGLIHGGHSSVFAIGHDPSVGGPWTVGFRRPDGDGRLGAFRLSDRGLGISETTYQHFVHEGRRYGHILDPRTAWPAEGVSAAAVTAPTAAEADALATAFYVLGPDPARELCDRRPELGAVLLTRDGRLERLGQAKTEFAPE